MPFSSVKLSHTEMSPVARLSTKQVSRLALLFTGLALSASAHAQLSFVTPSSLSDNLANQGSPILVNRSGALLMYYVNHSNNTIYVDFGLGGSPNSTGLGVYTNILTDVGAAQLSNGQMLLSYINTSGQIAFALSNDGINFSAVSTPAYTSLGLPSGNSPNVGFTPALVSNNGTVYVATVNASNNEIYIATTTNGTSYTAVTPGTPPDSLPTISRPSLTVYSGNVWMGYTAGSQRYAVVGNIVAPSTFNAVSSYTWSNSNRVAGGQTYWAGVSIMGLGNVLYLFGQTTNSNQNLYSTYSSTPSTSTSWSPQAEVRSPVIQMRWTPSALFFSNAYLAYQNSANTNISFTHN
jgi:hypothetical protein